MRNPKRATVIVAQLLAAALLAPVVGAQPTGPTLRPVPAARAPINPALVRTNPAIDFAAGVPAAPAQMRRFTLTATPPPVEFLNEKLQLRHLPTLQLEKSAFMSRLAVAPAAELGAAAGERLQPEMLARMPVTQALAEDKVRAFADQQTGDAHFLPSFAEQVREPIVREPMAQARLMSLARAQLTDVRFIPKDATELRLGDAIAVMGGASSAPSEQAAATGAQLRADPRVVMSIVPAVRYADGYPVFGRGSRALVTLDNDGSVIGALRRWRTAAPADVVVTSQTSAEAVKADIQRQLGPWISAPGARATVDAIRVAYYDGNAGFLQPVYEFEATVQPPPGGIVGPFKLEGFVPIGKPMEPIPDLAAPVSGASPATPPQASNGVLPRLQEQQRATPRDFTLGEYANQDWPNDSGYVDMSNTFLAGLTAWPFHPPIARTQWYVAYPWEVVGPSSRSFMNAVNVAYTVPHGDWLVNSTLRNCCDAWHVPDIGTGGNPGFGAAAGGQLATWIIMSCEVIPSMYDRQYEQGGTGNPYTAFDAWWPVFQGLHNVIGFRTIMFYPDDALQFGFGWDAAMGGDLNSAWFQEVAANEGGRGTYASRHLIGGPQVHYDRASTMIDARDLSQSIYSVGPQSASSTLWNFWMGD